MKDEIPPLLVDAHAKNIEAHSRATDGEVDPTVGLARSGIVVEVLSCDLLIFHT